MEAIVLAGGMGTRLRAVVADMPKPMAPIGDKPFLEYLIKYLVKHGVHRIILSTGYQHEVISNYFGDRFGDTEICYSVEKEPLGTGGGIKKALGKVLDDKVLIANGDTFFDVDLKSLFDSHVFAGADLTISLKRMKNFDRYGTVLTDGQRVTGFIEKKYQDTGNINGGVYLANRTLFEGLSLPEKFSFETDFMGRHVKEMHFNALVCDSYFIDIGIPQDYYIAQRELAKFV